jgi:hypothetical protein
METGEAATEEGGAVRRTSKIFSTAVFFSAPARTMANGSIAEEGEGMPASR